MEVPTQPCPFPSCNEERPSSTDAFSWNTEGYGKCHSCGEGYPSTKGLKTFDWAKEAYPVPEKKDWKKIEVATVTYENIRGIQPDVAKLYGIQLHLDAEGNPVRYAFKHPTNVKYRSHEDILPDGKKEYTTKERGVKMMRLFGPDFNAGSSKRIYITEGEFDAASLYQALGKTYPVKSLPSASIGDPFIKAEYDYLSKFEEIVYAGEQDKAGKEATERLYRAFPEKFWSVPLTKWKDANEFILNGDTDDLKWAALKPQRYSPDNFFCSDSEFLAILREENPYEATPTGHSGVDYMIRGMVRGGVTFIKAPPGTGKTEVVRYFERAMLAVDDIKVGMVHMEEQKSTTLRAMATYELGINVRTDQDQQENEISDDEVEKAALAAAKGDRTIIFEMRASDDPIKIVEYVRLAAGVYGADFVFVDHVQRLVYKAGIDGATNTLTMVASQLAELGKELNIGIIMISHVNEDGHTKYAKSLEEEAIICLKIERDKKSEDEEIKNTTTFIIEKNRPFSRLGDAGAIYYDPVTTILTETERPVFDA